MAICVSSISEEENQETEYFQVDVESDFNFFKKQLSDPEFKVQHYFDKRKWRVGDTFQLRVGHVYDLSHFWIVVKFKELEILQKYLNDFYTQYREDYRIKFSFFKLNMFCVCYTDGAYYRGCFTGIEPQYSMEKWAFVFLIDFGYVAKVPISELYFMTKNMYDIPRLAVRALWSEVCPPDLKSWSSKAVNNFNTEVQNIILTGMVSHVATSCKVLYLWLRKFDAQTGQSESVGHSLIQQGEINSVIRRSVRKSQQRLLFLEPSFRKLEEGLVPDMHVIAKGIAEKIC